MFKGKVGRYCYVDDSCVAERAFGGRSFKVVLYRAYDAGIVGTECNGVAVLDEDFQAVVLDEHMQEGPGAGHSSAQVAEFARVAKMSWAEFSKFCREHPRYRRGSVPDVNEREPRRIEPMRDRIVFPESAKDPECPVPTPLQGRREIVQFLSGHAIHDLDGRGRPPYGLAWDVKVRNLDSSGRAPGFKPDPAFDARWDEYVQGSDEAFWDACRDALSAFVEGEYATWPGDDGGQWRFCVSGRSGGWLVLSGWSGPPSRPGGDGSLGWETQLAMKQWLAGLPDADLVRLYRLVAQVDSETANPGREVAYRLACMRQSMEAAWASEGQAAPGPGQA
jgi:hypothetical protein